MFLLVTIHDYMSIVDLSDQRLMTVSHPPRWISVLNFVFCGTLFVSFPPFLFVTILSTLFHFLSIIIFALWQYLIDVDMDKVEEMFTDTRGILRSLKSEKGRQKIHNCKLKVTNKNIHFYFSLHDVSVERHLPVTLKAKIFEH
jgi:hypothetical protein